MSINIGIIGYGFVGKALDSGFRALGSEHFKDIFIYDPVVLENNPLDAVLNCNFVFICVPTPMETSGEIDISIVNNVLSDLSCLNYNGVVVIKSTTTPVKIHTILKEFPDLKIITNPEYLTERCAYEDFIKSPWIVVGDNNNLSGELIEFYGKLWPSSKIIKVSAESAMMAKYMTNSWFATKVSILNEFRKLWDTLGYDNWEDVVNAFSADERVGPTHLQVPGPDGDFGFGGKCFVKDINAMMHMCREAKSPHNTMLGACKTNNEVRTNKDWLQIKGAVSESYVEHDQKRSLIWFVDISTMPPNLSTAKLKQIHDFASQLKFENIDNIYIVGASENKFSISETEENMKSIIGDESKYLKWLENVKSCLNSCITVDL